MLKKIGEVGGLTLISRVLGLVRDLAFAAFFGASGSLDAFLVAFKIPNFFRRVFAEGAFTQALMPNIAHQESKSLQAKENLMTGVGFFLSTTLFFITVLVCLYPEWLVKIFAPGFLTKPDKFLLTSQILVITFPYLFLVSLVALLSALLNYHNKFFPGAFSPILLNISFILFCFLGASYFNPPIMALAWALLLGGIAQLLLIRFNARFVVYRLWWGGWRHFKEVREVLIMMIPALFGVMVVQVNLMVDMLIASFLQDGSLSWLYYADRLVEFPVGIFGIALATVLMPQLSRFAAQNQNNEFSKELTWGGKLAIIIGIPAVLGLVLVGSDAVSIIFERGAFSASDTHKTYLALVAYALGIPAFILIKIYTSAFYAQKRIKIPVIAAAISCISNIILNLIFVQFIDYAGLALATSLAAWVNVAWLYVHIRSSVQSITKKEGTAILFGNTVLCLVVFCYFIRRGG